MTYYNVCVNCDVTGECIWVPHVLLLQHDCNLVQFRGQDGADRQDSSVYWSSNSRRTDVDDCYLYNDEDRPRIYSGKLDRTLEQLDPRAGEVLWDGDPSLENPCSGPYEVIPKAEGGLLLSC